jgi:hypothetical protein
MKSVKSGFKAYNTVFETNIFRVGIMLLYPKVDPLAHDEGCLTHVTYVLLFGPILMWEWGIKYCDHLPVTYCTAVCRMGI